MIPDVRTAQEREIDMERHREDLRKYTKNELINIILGHDARDALASQRHYENEVLKRELLAAKQSFQDLEKVQQEMVARLERAYEAVVAATLGRRAP